MFRALGLGEQIALGSPCWFLAHSQGSRRKRRMDAESPLMAGWGRGEGAGLYAAACSKGWFFYCLLLYG